MGVEDEIQIVGDKMTVFEGCQRQKVDRDGGGQGKIRCARPSLRDRPDEHSTGRVVDQDGAENKRKEADIPIGIEKQRCGDQHCPFGRRAQEMRAPIISEKSERKKNEEKRVGIEKHSPASVALWYFLKF